MKNKKNRLIEGQIESLEEVARFTPFQSRKTYHQSKTKVGNTEPS